MGFTNVGTAAFLTLGAGAVLSVVLPLGLALLWKTKKQQPFSTILVGAATFLLFALILEKPIQALVISADHPVGRFLNDNPVWLALVLGLFPGVFEETGRLAAFKTVLKNRKNRETAISYGIGHGGVEAIVMLGMAYITFIVYAVMINNGTFDSVLDQAAAQAPEQVDVLRNLAEQLEGVTAATVALALAERGFAVLFHIGASILVFYACRDRGRFWLYPLAILLHTALDFIAGLVQVKVLELPLFAMEALIAAFGILTFCGAYFLLYRKAPDTGTQ